MATDDVVGQLMNAMAPPTGTNRASPSAIGGLNYQSLLFDDSNIESYDLIGSFDHYNDTSVIVEIPWFCIATPDQVCTWEIGINTIAEGFNLAAVPSFTFQNVVGPQASGANEMQLDTITFTPGQMGNPSNKNRFVMRIRRPAGTTQSGDCGILWPLIRMREA